MRSPPGTRRVECCTKCLFKRFQLMTSVALSWWLFISETPKKSSTPDRAGANDDDLTWINLICISANLFFFTELLERMIPFSPVSLFGSSQRIHLTDRKDDGSLSGMFGALCLQQRVKGLCASGELQCFWTLCIISHYHVLSVQCCIIFYFSLYSDLKRIILVWT